MPTEAVAQPDRSRRRAGVRVSAGARRSADRGGAMRLADRAGARRSADRHYLAVVTAEARRLARQLRPTGAAGAARSGLPNALRPEGSS